MALSIPVLVNDDQAFPNRNLILFITFIVILMTLVFQGLTLPWVIRRLKPEDRNQALSDQMQEKIIQKKIAHASLQFLEEKYAGERGQNERLDNLFARLEIELNFFNREIEAAGETNDNSLKFFQTIYLEMLESQRARLNDMNHLAEFDEELIRKYLSLIDIEEYKIREKLLQNTDSET